MSKIKVIMMLLVLGLMCTTKVSAAEVTRIDIVTQDGKGINLKKADGYVNANITVFSDNNRIENAVGQVKVRGNTTADAEKKPYKIKFSKKQNVLGMGKNKKWNLLANSFDPTLERNYIAFYIAKKMRLSYTTDFEYIDLYMDDIYVGNYLMTESIDVNENSVDISIDNGEFLIEYEAARNEADEQYIKTSQNGYRFVLHEPEEASDSQINQVVGSLDLIEDVMINGGIKDISKVIDLPSFIDFYILNEYMKTIDIGYSSVYFYYKNGKLYAGPAWDYDLSSGNSYKDVASSYEGIKADSQPLFKLLLSKEGFQEMVKYRYIQLQDILNNEIPQVVDGIYLNYYNSFNSNFQKWDITKNYKFMRQPDATYEDNLAFLKNWFINRNQWLLDYWEISEESQLIDYMDYLSVFEEAALLDPEEYYNYDSSGINKLLEINPFSDTNYDTQEAVDKLTSNIRKAINSLLKVGSVLYIGAPYKEVSGEIVYDVTEPHILINQIYGGKKKESYASHSFIELYNPTDKAVDLSGWSVQYRSSIDGEQNTAWSKLDLTGTIPSQSSYLVRCSSIKNPIEGSITIDNYDQEWDQVINNKGCSVALIANNKLISADSVVFDNETGQPTIYDFVDMVGVSGNDTDTEENIANEAALYFEKEASKVQSKKNGIRRKNLTDTDNNSVEGDFEAVDYSFENADYIAYISPKCVNDGAWIYDENNIPSYTVTYVNATPVGVTSEKYLYTSKLLQPEDPERVGYDFTGWYTESSCAEDYKYTFGKKPTTDVTLYAGWKIKEFTLSFETNSLSIINDVKYDYNAQMAIPTEPEKEGYAFAGWYTDEKCTIPFEFGKMPANDVKVYAKWTVNTYKLSFETNGGSAVDSVDYEYGAEVSAPITEPTKEGYTFGGWYADKKLTSEYEFTTMPSKNVTVYAKWIDNSYELSFESNGGSAVTSKNYSYGEETVAPAEPVKEGYTFAGWYSDEKLTKIYEFTTMSANDVKVYAKWTANTYKLSFETNGGNAVDSVNYEYGAEVSAPTIESFKEGYTFSGWYADKKLTSEYEFVTMPAKNITVYAKWTDNSYELSFESNGGSAVTSKNYSYGEETVAPAEPVKEGYTFAGWYSDDKLTEAYEFTTMPSNDVKVYAKWTVNTYKLSFETNGGSAVDSVDYEYGAEVSAPTTEPIKEGHTFGGWYADKKLTSEYEFTTMPSKNVTVYAKWTDNSYELSFESNGGSEVANKNYSYGEETVAPAEPVKEGYTFAGWYSDEELTKAYEFTTMPSNDVKVYAKWTVNIYKLSFETNGGSAVDSVDYEYGAEVSALTTEPIKEGHTFGGWYADKKLTSEYEFTTMPSKNVTVYAKWIDNSYEIRFESNGGSAVASMKYAYGEETVAPAEPTKVGYTFAGWYSDKDLTKEYEFTNMPASDVKVYAKWIVNSYNIHFVTNGGNAITDITVKYGSDISSINDKQIPVKDGYTFTGWYSDRKLTKICELTTMPANDITFYAGWIPVKSQVSFDTAGGSSVGNATVTYGKEGGFAEPVKEGYTFTGWYVDEACTVPYDPDKVYSDKVTLHAGWKSKEYTVKWEDFDGKVIKSEKVAYGKNGSAPVDPERVGYTFTGWSEKSDNIVSNMTIEALYEKITILLSADYEMPDDASSTEITDGDKVSLSEITLYTEKYKKAQFSAKVIGSKLPVRWSSSDTNIASVSKSGKVTVKKAGMVNITATCGGAEATCRVVVKKAAIGLAVKGKESVYKSVTGSSTKMNKSQTYNLKVTAVPNGKVTCRVGNKKILKVSTTKKANVLKIKALKKGNTTLTVEVNGIKRKIKVKVKK